MASTDPAPPPETAPGFFGKLPAVGDFVTRRLPRSFVDAYDGWLQRCLASSREQLGDDWLDLYLTSPVWRGLVTPGVCGDTGWLLVAAPSVDRVGRYFPLTVASAAPAGAGVLSCGLSADAWFEQAESTLLDCLESRLDLDTFDAQVCALGAPPPPPAVSGTASGGAARAWRFGAPEGLNGPAPVLAAAKALDQLMAPYSVWWSEGSDLVRPSMLVCAGLPPPEGFSSLMDGRFGDRGWADSGDPQWPLDAGEGVAFPIDSDDPGLLPPPADPSGATAELPAAALAAALAPAAWAAAPEAYATTTEMPVPADLLAGVTAKGPSAAPGETPGPPARDAAAGDDAPPQPADVAPDRGAQDPDDPDLPDVLDVLDVLGMGTDGTEDAFPAGEASPPAAALTPGGDKPADAKPPSAPAASAEGEGPAPDAGARDADSPRALEIDDLLGPAPEPDPAEGDGGGPPERGSRGDG